MQCKVLKVIKNSRDKLFADAREKIEKFEFDENVASVFPDMIGRSVPGYKTIVEYGGQLAAHFAQSNSNCYDLGCSLGATTKALHHSISERGVRIFAIDNSSAMIERCKEELKAYSEDDTIIIKQSDICDINIENASVVIMNFTLQFVLPQRRDGLIAKIFNGLNEGGCLIISEKVLFNSPGLNDLMVKLHHQFKRVQGYSDLEVSQKREAIENVLIPESLERHFARLREVGFQPVTTWFQSFNFYSILAIKPKK